MSVSQFNLPDVGEGLTEAEIVSWKVKPGDTVKVNDVIVEIETAKSLVELPCPFAGVVEALLVEEATTVPVGTPIIAVRTGEAASPAPGTGSAGEVGGPTEDLVPSPPKPKEERQAVLVGYGPRTASTSRRPRKTPVSAASVTSAAPAPAAPVPVVPTPVPVVPALVDRGEAAPEPGARALAKPPVRKLAKDLGVDLTTIVPSGPNGTVTREDVHAAAAPVTPAPVAERHGAVRAGAGWRGQ
ncbi:MAG TPA: biotin/lipoyl-containing protein, partial [Jiangellaceae bacterium]